MHFPAIDPLTSAAVVLATAATDVVHKSALRAPWLLAERSARPPGSASRYLLSSFAVISYTNNWAYVIFASARVLDWRVQVAKSRGPSAPAPDGFGPGLTTPTPPPVHRLPT